MYAVPAKPGLWKTIKLSDGTEVRAQLVGDEYGHWLQDANGKCYIEKDGVFQVVDIQDAQEKREARIAAKKSKRRVVVASTTDGLGQYNKMSMGAVPSIGEYTIPVVMVQFSDKTFKSSTTVEKMTRYYNKEGYKEESGCVGSVRDYFKAQSGGRFIPTFDVVGIVTLDKSYSYYGKGDDENLDELPGDVIAAAVEQLDADFSQYVVPAGDENHTAGVPLLAMFYAGEGEATGGSENTLWPCEWDDVDDRVGRGTYQDVHFNSFFIGNELMGSSLMGIGVFCHEFGHALGLPDFYVTNYAYEGDDPFGNWSIMDTGAYVADSYAPIGYNAYERSYMGWLDLKEIDEDAEEITLKSPAGTFEESAYIIRNSNTETFIFENRQPGTWYPSSYGSGVLVSRIAYNSYQWSYNTLNNVQSKKRACVLTANGAKLNYSASSANLYGGNKKSIGSLKTYSGGTIDAGIEDITKNGDGTITLTLSSSTIPDDPETPTGGKLFYESFDKCEGKGGNDDLWNGSIAGSSMSSSYLDNEGWSYNNAYKGNKCARLGKKGTKGTTTTPAFTVNGTATLSFKAGAWDSDSDDGTKLNLSVSNGKISTKSVTMKKGAWSTYTATITATGKVEVTFTAEKGRFFLDEVLAVDPNAPTAIEHIAAPASAVQDSRIFTLDGRYVGTDKSQLHRGIYIVNGKKVVIK